MDIEALIYYWNMNFPIDRWFRQKYKIPIFSKSHRDACFIDQLIEFNEDLIFNKLNKEGSKVVKYEAGEGEWLKERVVSQEEIDNMFDNFKI